MDYQKQLQPGEAIEIRRPPRAGTWKRLKAISLAVGDTVSISTEAVPPPPPPDPEPGWVHDFRTQGMGPFGWDDRWGNNGLVYSTRRNSTGTDHSQAITNQLARADAVGLHLPLKRMSTPNGAPMGGCVVSTKASGLRFPGGIFTARMRWDMGRAYWPAFWLLADGSGKQHEIDILEAYGQTDGSALWNGYEVALHNTLQRLNLATVRDVAADVFHEIGVEYQPGRLLRFFADGRDVATWTQAIPTLPMSIIFNLVAGSYHAGVDASTPDGELLVEWVRVQ